MLFETPAGFALFKVLDEGKLDKVEVSYLFLYMYCGIVFYLMTGCSSDFPVNCFRICGRNSQHQNQLKR